MWQDHFQGEELENFLYNDGMFLSTALLFLKKGQKVKRKKWSDNEYYLILDGNEFIIVIYDEYREYYTLTLEDLEEKDWVVIKE